MNAWNTNKAKAEAVILFDSIAVSSTGRRWRQDANGIPSSITNLEPKTVTGPFVLHVPNC